MAEKSIETSLISKSTLRERIDRLPRVTLAHVPTPLEEAPRLRERLGPSAPRVLIKREDLTGFTLGGNKVRHLEFRLADIRRMGADSLVVTNVAQSNHARLHLALAAKYGLDGYLIKIPSPKDSPVNGNLLLDHIVGARVIELPDNDSSTVARELDNLVSRLQAEGRTVYDVPRNEFSRIAGTCAYFLTALELLEQLDGLGTRADHIFLAAGASSAGLALAAKALGASLRVHPVSVGPAKSEIEAKVCASANKAAELLELNVRLEPSDVEIHDEYVGVGYGVPSEAGLEALQLAGRSEGLILDPVYTSKALSALIGQIRAGRIGSNETVVFIHTGGLPIAFAYNQEILDSLPLS